MENKLGKKSSKKHSSVRKKVIGLFVIILGLLGAAYPAISNYVFENRADSMVYSYEDAAADLEDLQRDELWDLANEYNETLRSNTVRFTDPFGDKFGLTELTEAVKNFADQLALDGTGVIGVVEVPVIDAKLPIYANEHYDQALERGVALVDGTSIPIGGAGTHAVISGHTGLNTAKIFTDLTSVEIGDQFFISILGETLAYQVDEINVVDPYDFSKLQIDKTQDYCTLLTCTPYGVNSHRLLVRGIRVEYIPDAIEQIREERADTHSQWVEQYLNAIAAGLVIVIIIFIILLIKRIIQNAKKRRDAKR